MAKRKRNVEQTYDDFKDININITVDIPVETQKAIYIYCKRFAKYPINEFVNKAIYNYLFKTEEGKKLLKMINYG